ncbi:MAG TPA: NAD(P)-dependent oxidoreductase [Candidatus Baltobacteraceae bacterium]|nr:NAD(P)-dependent oxidoreductase [Candidatus Baltobacteraceae bacterium]
MQVFIAGATGVIGRNLIPLLRERGHVVQGLSRDEKGCALLRELGVEPQVADLLDTGTHQDLQAFIEGCEAIVHVATALGKHPEAPSREVLALTGRLRTEGAGVLLRIARDCGVRRYVQESVELAYPDCGDEWIDESVALDGSKERASLCGPVIDMELLVENAHSQDLLCTVLRGGRLVGPETGQINAIKSLHAGTMKVAGSGRQFISPVHVRDYARAIVLALEATAPPLIVNVNAEPVREGDYLDVLADSIGAAHPERVDKRGEPPSHRCASERVLSTLGWEPEEPLF